MASLIPLTSAPGSIRALLFDIDKTLSNTYKEISPRTQAAVLRLVEQGELTLGVCSGRSPAMATEALSLFPSDNYHVLNGGGTIVRSTGEIVWERRLPSDLVQEIATQAAEIGAEYEFEAQGQLVVSPRKYERSSVGVVSSDQIEDWSTALLCVQWINEPVRRLVQQFEGLEVKEMLSLINGPYLDITPEGVNKATGLAQWSELTGIELAHVAGFGDSANDLEFLGVVGWAVAMGNATPDVQQLANAVIGHTNEDGLARYLEEVWL